MSSRSKSRTRRRNPEKPPPAALVEKKPWHPSVLRAAELLSKPQIAWLVATLIFVAISMGMPKTISSTFTGEELSGNIHGGPWQLTIVEPLEASGTTSFWSGIPGFQVTHSEGVAGITIPVNKNLTASWQWSGAETHVWNGNAMAEWEINSLIPITVKVVQNNTNVFLPHLFTGLAAFGWVMSLLTPIVLSGVHAMQKRRAVVTQ
jgi:hypothetical protein